MTFSSNSIQQSTSALAFGRGRLTSSSTNLMELVTPPRLSCCNDRPRRFRKSSLGAVIVRSGSTRPKPCGESNGILVRKKSQYVGCTLGSGHSDRVETSCCAGIKGIIRSKHEKTKKLVQILKIGLVSWHTGSVIQHRLVHLHSHPNSRSGCSTCRRWGCDCCVLTQTKIKLTCKCVH